MYAELMGNHEKRGIKSPRDNKTVAEGRFIYDVFVLNNKKNAIWYQGTAIPTQNAGGGTTGGGTTGG